MGFLLILIGITLLCMMPVSYYLLTQGIFHLPAQELLDFSYFGMKVWVQYLLVFLVSAICILGGIVVVIRNKQKAAKERELRRRKQAERDARLADERQKVKDILDKYQDT